MKKYLVIGNPVEHSLSPQLHNYWLKKNNIKAIYEKKLLKISEIQEIILQMKKDQINGVNVTIPFKNSVIPFLDDITDLAKETQSVNTLYKKKGKVIGDNTDVGGFKCALENINYNVKEKKILILGAGGVAPSVIAALKKMGALDITLSNRTKDKAEKLKKIYPDLKVIDWGKLSEFDMVINATSLGLKKEDKIEIDYSVVGSNKFFYDIIYSPSKTKFLSKAKELLNQTENGKKMFIYQAQLAFEIWHGIKPEIDDEVIKLLDND